MKIFLADAQTRYWKKTEKNENWMDEKNVSIKMNLIHLFKKV